MDAWLETGGALMVAVGGYFLGKRCAGLPRRWWMLGFFLPISVVMLHAFLVRKPEWGVLRPVTWIAMGRAKYAIFGFVAAWLLTTLQGRLPRLRDRRAMSALMLVFVGLLGIWPFAAPAFNQRKLQSMVTRMGNDGVCLQNTDYTCGPAAAVTALRSMGMRAEEGEIGRWARTTSASGTPPEVLADALREHYSAEGLTAQYRVFEAVSDLRGLGPTLVVVKFSFMLDHYVTVLGTSETEVVVGDPLSGKMSYTWKEFEEKWRRCGVVLTRK